MAAGTAIKGAGTNGHMTKAEGNEIAQAKPTRITTAALAEVEKLLAQGRLILPKDYHAANALNAAWLTLQETKNREGKPVINPLTGAVDQNVITMHSVVNALRELVIWGLNTSKKQCYFIVYGQQLVCQRSYFGDMLLAKRARPNTGFYHDTIRESEAFATGKVWSKEAGAVDSVVEHDKPFPRKDAIIGAYCGAFDTVTGEHLGLTLFDMPRIRKSWSKSKSPQTQNEFPEEMALRTVIRHRCKMLINTSSDQELIESIERADMDALDAEITADAEQNANAAPLHLPEPMAPSVAVQVPIVDETTGEIMDADGPDY